MVKVDEHSSSKQIPSFLHVDYVDKTSKQELEDICKSPFFTYCRIVYIWDQNKVNHIIFYFFTSIRLII